VNSQETGLFEQGLRIVRQRKWVILQATIAVPVIAFLFTLSQEKQYTANATLLFLESPIQLTESASAVDPTRQAATNSALATLPVVAERASKSLEGVSGEEVLGSVEVTPSNEANTATIAAVNGDPQLAAEIANAYGEAYIAFRRNTDRGQVQEAIQLAEATLEEMTAAEQEGEVGQELRTQLDQLRLEQALQTGGAELVQPATPPGAPSSPHPTRNVVLGLVLGLLLGLGLAMLLDRFDRRVRTSEEMEELYGLPVLAQIPASSKLANGRPSSLSTQTPEGEAFRVLRSNLRFFNIEEGLHTVLLVSPEEGDGKSTVARGLAHTMAAMGDDVVLVEADLRKGGEFRQVNGSMTAGLSNVLTGTPIENVIVKITPQGAKGRGDRTLAVVPSGPVPPNPSELLDSDRMRKVLEDLRQMFDFVILDSPALGAVSDALTLVRGASDIVVVGGLGKTTRDGINEVRKQFTLLDKRPIGIIVNFSKTPRAKYSHYYRQVPA
jgi:capsular exopolysaccharide synthesis family protein